MVILDTCAALEIAQNTEEGIALGKLIYDGEEVIVPSHFYAEFMNALYKYVRGGMFSLETAMRYYKFIASMITNSVDTRNMVDEILSEAVRLKHPAYDMAYFVLARRNYATLLTVDKRLAKLCEENGVSCVHCCDM